MSLNSIISHSKKEGQSIDVRALNGELMWVAKKGRSSVSNGQNQILTVISEVFSEKIETSDVLCIGFVSDSDGDIGMFHQTEITDGVF